MNSRQAVERERGHGDAHALSQTHARVCVCGGGGGESAHLLSRDSGDGHAIRVASAKRSSVELIDHEGRERIPKTRVVCGALVNVRVMRAFVTRQGGACVGCVRHGRRAFVNHSSDVCVRSS
jgi:hypothetical protein